MSKAYGYAIGRGKAILSGATMPATRPPMTVVQKPQRPVMPKIVVNPAANLLQRRLQNASNI